MSTDFQRHFLSLPRAARRGPGDGPGTSIVSVVR